MKPHAPLCAFAAIVTTLAACSGQNSSAPSTAQRSSTVSETAASSPSTATPQESPTTTDRELIDELVSFTSPSGDVGCYIAWTTVRCDISERTWSSPSRPLNCEFDYGQGISMSPGGQPAFVGAGDTALGGGKPLAYGKSLSAGTLVCDSAESGITCRDTGTGHGFSIAREAYRVF
jgi:hypothetical protein